MSKLSSRLDRRPVKITGSSPPIAENNPLGGAEVITEAGPVFRRLTRFNPSYRHGRRAVGDFLKMGAALPVLAGQKGGPDLHPAGAVFLDTETTGLAGGTGTIPFLTGLAWFESDGGLRVEQYLSRHPGEEAAQLCLVAQTLCRAEFLVTFNGKAFDVPLLNTRFILNRQRNPGYALPHYDLLLIARRIFRRRLDNCRLMTLESAVLNFQRVGDIPGAEIPRAYFDYVKGGPVEPIAKVLEHNALDLAALAALAAVLDEMYTNPETVEHALDHLGLARTALDVGHDAAADSHLGRAARSPCEDTSAQALLMSARAAARKRDWPLAAAQWLEVLRRRPSDAAAHLGLAKYFEHTAKEYTRALDHARYTRDLEGQDGSAKRVARLQRKLLKDEI